MKRLGVILPSFNVTAERDAHLSAPPDVSVHVARMYLRSTEADDLRRMIREELPGAIRQVASVRPDAVLFACTAAGAVAGPAGEAAIVDEIERAASCPVLTINQAVATALADSGGRRVALLTAFDDDVTTQIADSVKALGFEVPVAAGMAIADPFAIAEVPPQEIVKFARREVGETEVDVVFVACGNLRAVEAREDISAALGRPVITSNQAALTHAYTAAGAAGD
jgi:maleate isomerase